MLVNSTSQLESVVPRIRGATLVGFDTEYVASPLPGWGKRSDNMNVCLVGFSVAADGIAWYVPVAHRVGHNADGVVVREILASALERRPWMHAGKHDAHAIQKIFPKADLSWRDSMVAAWLAGRPSLGLKSLSGRSDSFESLAKGRSAWDIPPIEMAPYACQDAIDAAEVGEREMLRLDDKLRSWAPHEMHIAEELFRMERRGLPFDEGACVSIAAAHAAELVDLEWEWDDLTPSPISISSAAQVGSLVDLGIWPKVPKTPSGRWQVTTATMRAAKSASPTALGRRLAELRLRWATIHKLHSTYTSRLSYLAAHWGGRLHSSFSQCFVRTGRFSSSAPNLQNIPARGDDGKELRRLFSAPPGRCLVVGDFSQLELRMLAFLAGPGRLSKALDGGEDLHQITATGCGVTRDQAKVINYCTVYGGGPIKIAELSGMGFGKAKAALSSFWEMYPELSKLKEAILRAARERGYVRTISGRRRDLSILMVEDSGPAVSAAERAAFNTPIQGGAADLVKSAMLEARDRGLRTVCQVHDELIVECDEADGEDVARELKAAMECAGKMFGIKHMPADVGFGRSWAEAKSHG